MPKHPITIDDLAQIKLAGDPQLSPDGTTVAYTVKLTNVEKNKYFTHLWLQPIADDTPRQFTFGEVSDTAPRWSPDNQSIAFIRNKDRKSQVWLLSVDGGEPRALSEMPDGGISDLHWSPNGKQLAFAFRPAAAGWTRDANKKREESGKSKPPRIINHPRYRLDGEGFHDERQHVWVCDTVSGKAIQISNGDYDDSAITWSPDSRTIAFASNRVPDADRHSYRSDIWLVPARGGKPKRLETPVGSKAGLAWSPNGKTIAYIGTNASDDPWPPKNAYLWVAPVSRGKARCLSGALDRSVGDSTLGDVREAASGSPVWSGDSGRLIVTVSDTGSAHLYAVDVASAKWTPLTSDARDAIGLTADSSGSRIAALIGTPVHPPEVFVGDLSSTKLSLRRLSKLTDAWLDTVQISKPDEFWVTQPDGARIQGWELRPPNFNAKRKYPCLLYVHGGPHGQYGNTFFHELQWHAARGYIVIYSNPRGSNGRDTEFGACIHRDWGNLDFLDVMAMADYAEAKPYVDAKRMAIAGGSYGGFMTNWAVGHTNRFKVGVTDRSICNWLSMVGTSDVPPPPGAYWPGVPWGEDMQRGWDMSPLKYVNQVRTPLLIIHSEGDLRCPISQSEEWFTALKWLKQEAVFVRYPPETSHGLSRNGPIDLRFDRLQRIGSWLDKYCLPATGPKKSTSRKAAKTQRMTR
jgi:dipeptidyl aminopeptidase/acylaminoacyl peptidase